jgi:hypothetical protein
MNELINKYNTSPEELDNYEWSQLVTIDKKYAEKINWDNFDAEDWGYFLAEHPEFANKCNMWKEMNDSASMELDFGFVTPQIYLLIHQAQFAEKFNNWDELTPGDWDSLIAEQPQFAKLCNCWDKFYDTFTYYGSWGVILRKQPQFAKKYVDVMRENNTFDINPWIKLLCNDDYPTSACAEFCDEWNKFTEDEWHILLEKHPYFEDKCPFDSKTMFL